MARPFWLLLLAIAAVLYGSLFPFEFSAAAKTNMLAELLRSLSQRPSRGDILANLILYLPIGLFWALSFPNSGWPVRVGLGTLLGTAMSVGVEIAQICVVSRSPSLYDVALNAVSMLAGCVAGHLLGHANVRTGRFRLADPAGALLAASWLAYRLYPYVPTLDWQQVKSAFKPLLALQDVQIFDATRHMAAWLAFAAIAAANRGGSGLVPLALIGGGTIAIRPFLHGRTLQLHEVIGFLAALLLCRPLAPHRQMLAFLLLATIVMDGLAPFSFGSALRSFQFIPFIGFVSGSIVIAVQALLQKVFLYGGTIWLLHRGGWRLGKATVLVATVLLVIEGAQTFLPNRTAEITDPLIAVLIACVLAILPNGKRP